METKYIIVSWPYSKELMDIDSFDEHSFLINDEKGLEVYGSLAFFVEESWYIKNKRNGSSSK